MTIYQQLTEEGIQKGMQKGMDLGVQKGIDLSIRNMLKKDMCVATVAQPLEVDIEMVDAVKIRLKSE